MSEAISRTQGKHLHGNCRALNCYWREDEDGNWHTGCGQTFVLNDGSPRDNRMRYCYHCGHRLRQRSYRAK